MTRYQQAKLFTYQQRGCLIKIVGVLATVRLKMNGSGMVTMVMYYKNRGVNRKKSRSVSLDTIDVKTIKVFEPVENWLGTTDETVMAYWR